MSPTIDSFITQLANPIATAGQLRVDILACLGLVVLVPYLYARSRTFKSNIDDKLSESKHGDDRAHGLPPGPPSWPIFGYLPGLPKVKPWEVFNKWAEVYGDIIYVPSFKDHIMILNSPEAVFELLERRGSTYSDRPHMVMMQLMGFDRSTAFAPYGQKWRLQRKIYNQQMNITAVEKFRDYQSAAARSMLANFLDRPEGFALHCRTFAAAIVMNISYGYQIVPQNDPIVLQSESTGLAFSKASKPGYYMVDNFPILRHLPSFFPFQTMAAGVRAATHRTRTIPFRRVVDGMKKGDFKRCFVSETLSDLDGVDQSLKKDIDLDELESREDVSLIKDIAGGIFGAGSATTTSALQSFILAMVIFPNVQKRAREELDHVLGFSNNGPGRLPTFEDRPQLPYIDAITKEILRWFPVTPSALPHVTTEDDVYKGYRIPKGTVLIPNAWNLLHDPKIYPNPNEFRPERFIPDENGNVARDPAVQGAFGFGRRICAGRNLADASIWIAAASVLALFDISPALDEKGKPIGLEPAFDGAPGFFDHPLPFKCHIEPRSERARKVILETCSVA